MVDPAICVIVAAHDAAATIDRAVRSALIQPEVTEVLVLDDCSTDRTATIAEAADDGSGRLRVIRMARNQGPAAARNIGIAASRAPYIAILDADDFFLPGRFAPMLAWCDLDMVADNILFVAADDVDAAAAWQGRCADAGLMPIDLPDFVRRNISRRGLPRGELGFLKPLIRRAFIDRNQLRYNERLRLGEDFDLYARMLAKGAKFAVTRRCGYVATERAESLSGTHATAHLAELAAADDAILRSFAMPASTAALFRRHRRQVIRKWRHRRFLDDKRSLGLARAVARAAFPIGGLVAVCIAVAVDKASAWRDTARRRARAKRPRLLIPAL